VHGFVLVAIGAEASVPIKAELRRSLYNTRAWRLQRARVFERAGGRCECRGQCGRDHEGRGGRCRERQGKPATGDGIRKGALVILTTAHVDGDSGARVSDEKLRCWCAGCHLRWDLEDHLQKRHENRMAELERRGQRRLL